MNIRKHIFSGAILVLCSLFMVFAGCGEDTYKNVNSLELHTQTIKAGKRIHIVPVDYHPAAISGTTQGVTTFKFTGTLLDSSENLTLITRATLLLGRGGYKKIETQKDAEPITWGKDAHTKELQFSFVVSLTEGTYMGGGYLYFYLTDLDDHCVSNIVAWPVTFQ